MARKGLSGQLNMFDFFRELEAQSPQAGELEMVSLMPSEEPEIEENLPEEESSAVVEILPAEEVSMVEAVLSEEKTPAVVEIIQVKEESKSELEAASQRKKKQKDSLKGQEEQNVIHVLENKATDHRLTMHRTYQTAKGMIEIAYINYNKVRITEPGKEPQLTEFESSKEAVNFYVDEMQRLEELYGEEE